MSANIGDPGGFKQTNPDVDSNPGENPQSTGDGIPRFSSGHFSGYTCLRCSDSGENDSIIIHNRAPVDYKCSTAESMVWDRTDAMVTAQQKRGEEPGNWFASETATPKENQDELESCIEKCNTLTNAFGGAIGTCRATTYDRNSNMCHFFYNCDKVKKVEGTESLVLDFNVEAQPEVINNNV